DVQFASGSGAIIMPGNHIALPDGRHVWDYAPKGLTDLAGLVKAAATQILPDAQLTAAEQRALPGEGSRLVPTLTRHPGGASSQVHAGIEESFTLIYDALVSRAGQQSVLPAAVGAGAAIATADVAGAAPATAAAESPTAAAIAAGEDPDALSDSLTNRYMP